MAASTAGLLDKSGSMWGEKWVGGWADRRAAARAVAWAGLWAAASAAGWAAARAAPKAAGWAAPLGAMTVGE